MNAVAYCRYSSDNQREESIEAQARAIRDYCEKNSYTLINIYVDEARSATTDNRPQFLQMMKDAEKKQFEAVIVHKLDRFSRDRYDSAIYRKHLKKHRIKLISVLERLDDSPESIILESVLEGMAEFYSRNLAREVMKGMRENAYKCKHTGGKPPLGYDVTSDKTYVINQFEAGAIRLIFSLYADSNGYGEIIKQLNEAGYKTKAGRTFGTNSLSELLRNEKYIGNFIFNRMEQRADGKRNSHFRKKDEDIIRVDGGIPAIIDIETWKRVKSRVDNNKSKRGIISKVDYLLSGKIVCGKCGGSMCGELVRNKLKNPYYYYACATRKRLKSCDNKNISKDYIEQSVINALFDNLFSPAIIDDAAKHIFESVAELQKDIPDDVKKMKSELSAANTKIKNIVDAIAEGMFQQSMKQKMDELTVIQQTLIIRIEEAVSQLSINKYSIKEIKDYLIQYQELKSMDPAEQKKCIEVFVDKIIVNDDDILVKAFTTKDKTEISIKIPKVLGHQGCQTTCTKSALQAMNSE